MKQIIKEENIKFGKLRTILRAVTIVLLIALLIAAYFLPRMLITGDAAEFYCRNIFPNISFIPLSMSSFFNISLTEYFVVVGSLTIICLTIGFIISLIITVFKQDVKHAMYRLYRVLKVVLILGIIAALIFQANHGINYNRRNVKAQLHLYGDERSYEEYNQALEWAYAGMINARRKLGEDYHGVAHMSTNFDRIVYDANSIVSAVSEHYDLGMSNNYVRAKAVSLSHFWTYTEIAGVYDPFLGEANINTDYLDILSFPVTVCHEISHVKGYASETDANTIAILSCINSPRADFQYAGYYYIFCRLYRTVSDYAAAQGEQMVQYMNMSDMDMVRRDVAASSRYDTIFETGAIADFIASFSEEANNAFLQSNGQAEGTETYRVPQDIFVEYFFRYVLDA